MRKTRTLQDFIEDANLLHANKYDYSRNPQDLHEVVFTRSKIVIVCPDHGEFRQKISHHLEGRGCMSCAYQRKILTQDEFIERSKEKHGDKYDYSQSEYLGVRKPVKIKCQMHGEFDQTPESHMSGHGCAKCGIELTNSKNSGTLDNFISTSQIIHNGFYSYEKANYINNSTCLMITCPTHGDFEQMPISHLGGHGCNLCRIEKVIMTHSLSNREFIEKSNIIHDFSYDYSDTIYRGSLGFVDISCYIHGRFSLRAIDHTFHSRGCPECKNNKSNGENTISKLLASNNILFYSQKTFEDCRNPETNRKLFFDFYLPDLNLIIEYDGQQHFKPINFWGGGAAFTKLQERDTVKNEYCKFKKIKLIRIAFNEKIETTLRGANIIA